MPFESGQTLERTYVVTEEHLAVRYGSGLAAVLSTPALVGFCEETARLLVDRDLGPGEQSVGASFAVRHLAPTPPGMSIVVRAELVEIEGRRLRFTLEARDEVETIATGEHVRVVVDGARFAADAAAKSG
ncbi:MAG: thioesterase family protein [Candidatus Bipolaricaulota bacterium]|nr:MAG: thioesterase family protein [Candidatus Bipolaricaulota bacterium]